MKVLGITALVLGAFVVVAVIIAVSAVLNGWVLTNLWHWFAVPIFGFHDLSIVQAIGVALIIGFLTRQSITTKKNDSDKTDWVATTVNLLSPLIVLLVGYIVHLFM